MSAKSSPKGGKPTARRKKHADQTEPKAAEVPTLKDGTYGDGHPLDRVQYLECKLILKPDRFTEAKTFLEFGALVGKTAKEFGISLNNRDVVLAPEFREVLFADTDDCFLYNNAFILRRRIRYDQGFLTGDPEIVFKFRHPDMQTAADRDVRPKIAGDYRIKFKVEALPLKDQIGGVRFLYSHNVEVGLSELPERDRTAMKTLASIFPCVTGVKKSSTDRIEIVNQTIVEEVLQDLGVLDFGQGITAKANIALWRERGMYRPLCGEFAFQAKFKRGDDVHEKTRERMRAFFVALQKACHDWLSLGTTKTGMVYRLRGNPPQAHE